MFLKGVVIGMKLLSVLLIAVFVSSIVVPAPIPHQQMINSNNNRNILADTDTSIEFIPTENFTHYKVFANLTWGSYPHVEAWETVIFKNTYSVSFNELHMHAWAGYFNKYVSGGEPPAFKLYSVVDEANATLTASLVDDTTLKIQLPSALAPDNTFIFTLHFEVNPPQIRDRFGYGTVHDKPIASFGNWLPVMAIYENGQWTDYPYTPNGEAFYAKSACFLVNISTPSNMVIAATGSFLGRMNIDSQTIWMWNATLTRDFTFSASRYFETTSIIHNGVNITSYYVSDDEYVGSYGIVVGANALNCYGKSYIQYPYDRLSIVETPMDYGGMEYPMLVQISDKTYSSRGYFEIVTAHEVGHQWWAYLSGNDPFKEPWLDEAFASYSEALYTEYTYGWSVYLDYIHGKMERYFMAGFVDKDPGIYHNMSYWDTHPYYGTLVYTKGAVVVSMLRYVMGNTTFFNAMHTYFKQYAFKIVHIEDFQHVMETEFGKSLNWFFDEWIYHGYLFTYSIMDHSESYYSGNYHIDFTISQSPRNGTMPINVTIYYESSTEVRRIWVNETNTYFTFETTNKPIKIVLDSDNLILAHYIYGEAQFNITGSSNNPNNNTTPTSNLQQIFQYLTIGSIAIIIIGILVIVYHKKKGV